MYSKDIHNGFVRVVRQSAGDEEITAAARMSYGEGTKAVRNDEGLIRYLMRHRHMSPFQFPDVVLHLRMPIFVARQFMRHRMDALNEYSGRYSEMPDDFYVPEKFHKQSKVNMQGSAEPHPSTDQFIVDVDGENLDAFRLYSAMLKEDISREEARMHLPMSTYTEFVVKMNLRTLLNFVELRSDSHAQKEIREYADAIWEMIEEWCPIAAKAFKDYNLRAVTLTAPEMLAWKDWVEHEIYLSDSVHLSKREAAELSLKMDFLE